MFHKGKWPKSDKTIVTEFTVLANRFPEIRHDITAEDVKECSSEHINASGLVTGLGVCYVVYRVFMLAAQQVQIIGCRKGSKVPSVAAYYRIIDKYLLSRIARHNTILATFNQSGGGLLDYLKDKEAKKLTPAAPGDSGTPSAVTGSAKKTRATKTEANSVLLLFILIIIYIYLFFLQ